MPRGWIPQVENLRPLSGRSSISGCRFSTCTGSKADAGFRRLQTCGHFGNLRPLSGRFSISGCRFSTCSGSTPDVEFRRLKTCGHFRKPSATFGHTGSARSAPSENAARGCPCPGAGVWFLRAAWRAKRRNHRASEAQDGRSERPAMGMGSPEWGSERGPHRLRDWASWRSEIPIAYAIGLPGGGSVSCGGGRARRCGRDRGVRVAANATWACRW